MVDAVFVALGYILVWHLVRRRPPVFLFVMLSLYSALFVWMNIEWRLYDIPIVLCNWPIKFELMTQRHALTSGFPLSYVMLADPPSNWILSANAAIGIAGWLFLYGVLRWARSYSTRNAHEKWKL